MVNLVVRLRGWADQSDKIAPSQLGFAQRMVTQLRDPSRWALLRRRGEDGRTRVTVLRVVYGVLLGEDGKNNLGIVPKKIAQKCPKTAQS